MACQLTPLLEPAVPLYECGDRSNVPFLSRYPFLRVFVSSRANSSLPLQPRRMIEAEAAAVPVFPYSRIRLPFDRLIHFYRRCRGFD